jgi:8-oxo-dGTP diphosphatase
MLDFICNYVGGELKTSYETSEIIWAPREKALEMVSNPVYKMRLHNLLDFSGDIFYHAYSTQPFEEHYHRHF